MRQEEAWVRESEANRVERERMGEQDAGDMPNFSRPGLYTGSAADYDRPSLVHVGTGEGSQVYGWGLYASNRRGVAEGYANGGRGHVYEQTWFTNRAEGDESHLISWYEPLKEEQKDLVRKALAKGADAGRAFDVKAFDDVLARRGKDATGQDLYRAVRDAMIPYGEEHCEKNASLFLAHADIDGVKYPVGSYGVKPLKDGDEAGWNKGAG